MHIVSTFLFTCCGFEDTALKFVTSFCRCSALFLCPLWPGYWSYLPGWLALQ